VTDPSVRQGPNAGIEMTSDARFARRVRRLSAVSSVALGVISLLALATTDVGWGAIALLVAGWITMPTLLAMSLERPQLRYLLVVPASIASIGLLFTATTFDDPALAAIGWWLIAAGVWLGGALGAWFWFRWVPVPAALDDPFSTARWSLVAVHIALIVLGGACVVGSAALL